MASASPPSWWSRIGAAAPGLEQPHELRQSRILAWASLVSAALIAVWAVILPSTLNTGVPWFRDPMVILATLAVPVFAGIYVANRRGFFRPAATWFVWSSFAFSWLFTVLIQGTGYLVGNYSYLAYNIILASVFVGPLATALVAVLNLIGVFLLGTSIGLGGEDLVLSYANLSIFAALLLVTSVMRERDERQLEVQATKMRMQIAETAAVMAGTEDAIVSLDENLRVRSWNRSAQLLAEKLLGRQPAVGEEFMRMIPAAEREDAAALLARVRYEGHTERKTRRLHDGRVLELAFRPLSVLGEDASIGVVVSARDITEHQARVDAQYQKVLSDREQEHSEALHRFKARILDSASHELNTPLTPIRMQMDLLRAGRKGPLTDDQAKALELVDRNLRRLEHMMRDLVEVARVEERGLRLHKESVHLDELVSDVVDLYMPLADERQVRVTFKAEAEAWLDADPRRLEQAVANLMTNAIKFTPAGGAVHVRTVMEDGLARVEVGDSGIGFDIALADDLFEPFGQLHDHSKGAVGAGLGLFIARNVAEAHGGRIGAHSDGPDRGARFWMDFPIRGTAPVAAASEEASEDAETGEQN